MKSLLLFACSYLLIALCKSTHAEIRSQHYTVDPSPDNEVYNTSALVEYPSLSTIECAAMCGDHCSCFGFHVQKRKCHIPQICNPADMTKEETGWRYYSQAGMLSYIPYISYMIYVSDISKLVLYYFYIPYITCISHS
jgi:hypothetical protein